jgi:NADH-quinone oxidoreductase subunit H
MLAGSMKLNEIVRAQDVWFILSAPIAAIIFFVSSMAENGRAPFDLMEAESEIVAGFNVEYSGLKFGFFFVGDFLHAFTIALLFSVLFLGGWRGPGADQIPLLGFVYMMIKTTIMYFISLLVRFSLPRFRIDQMMNINWKMLTPLALGAVMATALIDKAMVNLLSSLTPLLRTILRTVILFSTNGLVLWVALDLMGNVLTHRERRVVAEESRPVARPEQPPVQPDGEVL